MSIRLSSAQVVKIKESLKFHKLDFTGTRYRYDSGLDYLRHNEVESLVEDILKEVLQDVTCLHLNAVQTQNEQQNAKDS